MTQFVYGKNVIAQLLEDGQRIHEIWILQGFRDQKLVQRIQRANVPVKWGKPLSARREGEDDPSSGRCGLYRCVSHLQRR